MVTPEPGQRIDVGHPRTGSMPPANLILKRSRMACGSPSSVALQAIYAAVERESRTAARTRSATSPRGGGGGGGGTAEPHPRGGWGPGRKRGSPPAANAKNDR